MRAWLFLSLAFLGTMELSGCDQLRDEQVQAASMLPPVAQPQLPQTPGLQEIVPNDEPLTWLGDTEDVSIEEIDWDALIPEDRRPETLMGDTDIENLNDDDPQAQKLLDKLKYLWSQAPVARGSAGQTPGFRCAA